MGGENKQRVWVMPKNFNFFVYNLFSTPGYGAPGYLYKIEISLFIAEISMLIDVENASEL